MTEQATEALREQLERLRQEYVLHLPNELGALHALASGLTGARPLREGVEELHHRLHKLAGSGGTFGFSSLSAAARALELQTRYWLEVGVENIDALTRQAFADGLGALDRTLGESTGNAAPTPRARNVTSPLTPQSSWNVWLVEDDELFGRELAYQLESFNFRVRRFTRISEAEHAAAAERCDLLIADVMLHRGQDATEAMSLQSNLTQMSCPVIFITAHDDFASRVRAVRMGASGYFLKPLDIPHMVARMTQILEKPHAQPERILIVEDDTPLAEHYRLVLDSAGMQAEVLDAPEHIMQTISAFRPDLILMDMHMPGFSGPELAGVVRQHEQWASLPIVYLSAEIDLRAQLSALGQGADEFLTKPISDAQLVLAVRTRVDRARVLEGLISRDSLTGLLKHSAIKEAAGAALARARRSGRPVCFVMIDIDHFKTVNDRYGHAVGDVVISALSTLLRQRLRNSDILGRYGGEEFLAVLPECPSRQALRLMNDIRQHFSNLHFSHGGRNFSCTLSAGVACSEDDPALDGEALLNAADSALYQGKRGGRNQVRAARPNPTTADSGDHQPRSMES